MSTGTQHDKEGLPAELITDDVRLKVEVDDESTLSLTARLNDLNESNKKIITLLSAVLLGIEMIADQEPNTLIENIEE
jgi:hypothetical protein